MNAEVAKLWVKALRSGKYAQGKHGLKDKLGSEDVYCCLGVLCDIAPKEVGAWSERSEGQFKCADGSFCSAYLPTGVQKWAGMQSDKGYIPMPYDRALTVLNDAEHQSFERIANVIEECAEVL